MMRNIVAAAIALAGVAALACLPAGAANYSQLGGVAHWTPLKAGIVKVHSQRQVHDMLHGYGFDRVIYKSQYYDELNKPVYRFRVCRGRRAYEIDVNWFGHIVDEYRNGRCHRYDW